jgi:quercetin dioxygenase-like cupin family protein
MKKFLAGVLVGLLGSALASIAQQGAQARASERVVQPQVVMENQKVKIVRWLLKPGEGTPVHTHTLDHVSVVIHGSSLRDVQTNGATSVLEQKTGQTAFIPGTGRTHSFANLGPETFESIAIELK